MTHTNTRGQQEQDGRREYVPNLRIQRIGIVSRDYRVKFAGRRDFSALLPDVFDLLDNEECDAVIFSLYGIIPRKDLNIIELLQPLKHISVVFIEEFTEKNISGKLTREPIRLSVYYKHNNWNIYNINQEFGTVNGLQKRKIFDFVENIEQRCIGNFCIILCGESNTVKYVKEKKAIEDTFGLKNAIKKQNVKIILNPIHDKMTRFEMKLKKKFLSEGNKWVISVWNKGRKDKRGVTKDGKAPAWNIFFDGKELEIPQLENGLGLEIGICDLTMRRRRKVGAP